MMGKSTLSFSPTETLTLFVEKHTWHRQENPFLLLLVLNLPHPEAQQTLSRAHFPNICSVVTSRQTFCRLLQLVFITLFYKQFQDKQKHIRSSQHF